MPQIGAHISVAGGLEKAFERAGALGCETMQIFTRSQRQWQARPVSLQEAESFFRAWQNSGVNSVVCHASYLINIASPVSVVREKSAAALREEIERCRSLNIDDIVLHPGFAMGGSIDAATTHVAQTLLRIFDATPEYSTRILLETMAGQGTSLGGDFAHFSEILDKAGWHPRIGLCIDTCHVFAAGYDIRSNESYSRLVALADKHVGLSRLRCWHLNDSKAAKGTHIDRHAHLGYGEIGHLPFALLMNDERFASTPAILETPKDGIGDDGNLAFLRKVRGR